MRTGTCLIAYGQLGATSAGGFVGRVASSRMHDVERYLFDLNGYIVVRSAMNPDEVRALLDDVRGAGVEAALETTSYVHAGFPAGYYDAGGRQDGEYRYLFDSFLLDWGPATRSLVAHPAVLHYIAALVGPDFRLDHAYAVLSRGRTRSHPLHNGAAPFDPTQMYLHRDGRMFNSMVVVQVALTEVAVDDGGFCCIPGSHKANFPLPPEALDPDHLDEMWAPNVRSIPMQPGDVLIFTEAVTHGAKGWRGAGDRVALLYKYCMGAMRWEPASPFTAGEHAWTPVEGRIMTEPYAGGRVPVVSPDELDG